MTWIVRLQKAAWLKEPYDQDADDLTKIEVNGSKKSKEYKQRERNYKVALQKGGVIFNVALRGEALLPCMSYTLRGGC